MKLFVRLPGGGEIRIEREPKERDPINIDWDMVGLLTVPVLGMIGMFVFMILSL